MGLTTVSVAGRSATFEPVALPDLRQDPEMHGTDGTLRADRPAVARRSRRRVA